MKISKLTLALFFLTILKCDDFMDDNEDDMEDIMPETISDMDSTEFVKDLEKYFETNPSDPLTVDQAIEVSIKIYSEATMEQIKEMEKKLEKEDAQLTDEEENLLYFKNHLQEYFNTHHQQEVTQDQLKEVIKSNAILAYLEKKMDEEEALMNDDDEEEGLDNDDDLDYPGDFDEGLEDMDDELPEDINGMQEEVNAN